MTVTFNSEAYLQERILIKVSGVANNARIGFNDQTQGAILTETVYYMPYKNHKLTIDVTDLVRADCQVGDLFEFGIFEDISGGDIYQDRIEVVGYTDPKNWLVPAHPYPVWKEWKIEISLPTKILLPIENIPSIFGIISASDVSATSIYQHSGGVIHAGYNAINVVDGYPINLRTQGTLRFNQQVLEQECNKRYVAVQWVGRDGHIKRATLELRRATENMAGNVEIENITNAYDVRKGSEITAVLHLGGLTAYDVWYYGDIVTSSDVRLALDASDYDEINDTIVPEKKIAVTSKKIEIPDGDGGKFYDLDIEINYKRYDTV